MLNNNSAFNSETLYKGPFEITQCWTNGTVPLQCGAIKLVIMYVKLIHIHLTLKNIYIYKFLKMMFGGIKI